MKTFAAFAAGVGFVVGFALLWSLGTAGRVAAVLAVAAAVLYGIFRLIQYRPEHGRGAGTLEDMKRCSPLAPLDEPPGTFTEDRGAGVPSERR